jgi:hypothetical protein
MDPENRGRQDAWFNAPRPDAKDAPVPGVIQQVFPDCHGVAWYWRTFQPIRTATAQERCILRFGAVDYLAEVWINGVPVGGHEGGETPFTLDVTHAVLPGRENLIAVRVLNPTEEPIDGFLLKEIPHRNKRVKGYQPGASYNYGGIILPVELLIVPALRITDIFARPQAAARDIAVSVTVRNDTTSPGAGSLAVTAGSASTGEAIQQVSLAAEFPPGESVHHVTIPIAQPRLWCPEDPFLYRVTVALPADTEKGTRFSHEHSVRCGFRDFRIENGYFRLNGKRIFLRSTHTGNHFPISQIAPQDPDFQRRDLLYAKTCGFNTVRFISGVAWPEQLDFCDEIGLMVYEECLAGWCLEDSPHMAERYDQDVREMVLRDRNHPSVVIWGMLNETFDGPVFREAVRALSLVRSLDETRLVLLNSGRWDCQPSIGSASNPGRHEWEHVWGIEAPNAPPVSRDWDRLHGGYFDRAGDAHVYPRVPHPPVTLQFIRQLGKGTKPVFLSEYGIGSLPNAVREWHRYEQVGAQPDLPDLALWRSMSEKLEADWNRLGFDGVYPFLEDFLWDSQRLHARQRLLGFDLIRSNPQICGFNLTGMLDHAITGEGVWTFWREWKPEVMDAMADGWAPLRWCLFVDPLHGYAGQPLRFEAVLANEDVIPPGEYPARFRVSGPEGIAREWKAVVRIPKPAPGQDPPLAVPVLDETIPLDGPAGQYEFAASLERCGAPAGGRISFHISDPAALPHLQGTVTLWGIEDRVAKWLESRGLRTRAFGKSVARRPEVILVGNVPDPPPDLGAWQDLARRMARGSAAVFLSPQAFKRGDNPVGWLPLATKGRCYTFHDWLYHKECVAKPHPAFDGLPGRGIMDWDYYGPLITREMFDGQETPGEVAAAAFAVGYCCPGGYASGVLLGGYRFGAGRFVLNTFHILENLGTHPAADRLLVNLIQDALKSTGTSLAPLPADFGDQLARIGYA